MAHEREVEPGPGPEPVAAAPQLAGSAPLRAPLAPGRLPAGVSNAALARSLAGSGTPLPSNAHGALRALGAQAADVRVHTGAAADARLAARPGALAVTEGTDIHVGSAAPALDSPGGRLLLAHEAVHVRQQTAPGPAVARAVAEAQADRAAVAASAGGPLPALEHAEGPLYFEARWHQASLTGALDQLGFTDAEQEQAYFANWCRDLSQAFVPMARDTIGTTAAFELVNLLAMHHFGHGVTPQQLGAYNPVEHIDNPAGTTDQDVMDGGVEVSGYGDQGHAAGPDAAQLGPGQIRDAFAVGAAGVPEYIERSRRYIEAEAHAAIDAGRTPEGLLHVGNFSHTCEDLFAHSNWIEIAVGKVVAAEPGLIPAGATRDEVQHRLDEHRPPIENFAGDVRDLAGRARPILSTGTFSGGGAGNDTLISIKAEAQNLLRDREPFKEDGGGGEMYDFAIEVLRHAEQAADEGSLGAIFAEVVEQAIGNATGAALGGLAELPGAARSTFGSGTVGDLAVGAAELLNEGAHAASDLAGDAWRAGVRTAVASAVDTLGPALRLSEWAVYLKGEASSIADAWKHLKDAVRELPEDVKALLLPALVTAEREFKARVRHVLNAAYGRSVEILIDTLEGIAPITDTAETNVEVKLAHWREQLEALKLRMADLLTEVGGDDGAQLAARVRAMSAEEAIGFAHSTAFQQVISALADDVAARVRLQGLAGDLGGKADQVAQLQNVPPWARAGASHSQTAKDHDDGAFFGIAFAVAQAADHLVLSDLRAAWASRGQRGPAAGLEGDFGGGPTGNEAEDARRAAFLQTRQAGADVVAHGHAESQDVGPRLAALADGLDAVVAAHPVLRPTLSGLVAVIRRSEDGEAILAELQATRARWEAAARSGELDDDVMAAVDTAIGQIARLAGVHGSDEHGDDHDVDSHHPRTSGDAPPGGAGRSETAYASQLAALQAHRGTGAVKADASVGADRANPDDEPIVRTIRRVFDHPYQSDWWVPLVRDWCREHGDVLERSIRDRNAGVMHSHAH